MSDISQGPGWWQASDGKWYPPQAEPGNAAPPPPPQYPQQQYPQQQAAQQQGQAQYPQAGYQQSGYQQQPQAPTPQNNGCLKAFLICLGIFVFLGIAMAACTAVVANRANNAFEESGGFGQFEEAIEEFEEGLDELEEELQEGVEEFEDGLEEFDTLPPAAGTADCRVTADNQIEIDFVSDEDAVSDFSFEVNLLDDTGAFIVSQQITREGIQAGERATFVTTPDDATLADCQMSSIEPT